MGINTSFIEFILIIKDNVMVQKKAGLRPCIIVLYDKEDEISLSLFYCLLFFKNCST